MLRIFMVRNARSLIEIPSERTRQRSLFHDVFIRDTVTMVSVVSNYIVNFTVCFEDGFYSNVTLFPLVQYT